MRLLILVLLLASLLSQTASGARIYFTDQPAGAAGSVISIAPDGTGQRTIVTVTDTPDVRGIAFASGRVYFLDNGAAKKIYSILPDGSDSREIVSVSPTLINSDLETDESAGKLYWSEANAGATGNGFIRFANLDGTGAGIAVTTAPGVTTAPYFLFLDRAAGYIYWGVLSANNGPSTFRRGTFAGEIDPDFAITTATRTRDIAIDPASATAFWSDRQTGTIFKRALSGGANQTVISGMNAPHGIALDVEAGKIYWADSGARGTPPQGLSARRVARCNLDGSEFENLSTPAANSEPWDLALDASSASYNDWRTRFFSTTSPAAAPMEDADGDGARNLLEYALGTHPQNASSVPRIGRQGAGIQFIRRRRSNLLYYVEVSTDLVSWHSNNEGSGLVWTKEVTVTPVSAEMELVAVSAGPALTGVSNAFFRLRVLML